MAAQIAWLDGVSVRAMSETIWAGAASLAAPVIRLMLRSRAARGKEITARLPEREGRDTTPRPPGTLIWLHAASVGETLSVLPVLVALPAGLTVLLTTGTVTSATLLGQRLPGLGVRADVLHRFAPLDVPAWAGRFLDHWRPDAAAFVESELWPNMMFAVARRGIPLLLLNARMSERSFRGWRRMPGLARRLLRCFAWIEAQSNQDAERLRLLGARSVASPGNLKFAADPLPADAVEMARLQTAIGERPVWLAASTHAGEEAVAGEVHARLAAQFPGLLTIIAPRHPERGPEIAAALLQIGGAVPRRAAGQDPPIGPGAGIWVADTLGDLGLLFRLAPVVFIGGSLVTRGGQNPLEPARLGCAVAVGPNTQNHAGAVEALRAAGAVCEVADGAALADFVAAMLGDAARRTALGEAGQAAASAHDGLPAMVAERLVRASHAGP